jgi:pimeloyl-ACP methyl ester carboxylesterase
VIRVPSTDGVEIAVHSLADTGDRPLLICHATGFCGSVFGPLASHLRGVRARALDFRGHGDSVWADDVPLGGEEFGEDVLAVIDGLDLAPCLGVGHSLGGGALLRAEQTRPGTFAGLFLFEPIAFPEIPHPDPPETHRLVTSARLRRRTFESVDAAYENFASKRPLDALDPGALRAYVEHAFAAQPDGSVELKCPPEIEARTFMSATTLVEFERLDEVRCPVTVAAGGDDRPPARVAPHIVEQLPRGTYRQFDSVGHFGPLQNPPLIAAAITEDFAL